MTYTDNGAPQTSTRNRFGDVPQSERIQAQWDTNRYDQFKLTETMRDALTNPPACNFW